MPFGDRTGPMGAGPMTGRAAGYCAGYDVPGYTNPLPGRSYGWGMGGGRGFRGAGRGGMPWGGGRGRAWGGGRGPGWGGQFYGAVPPYYAEPYGAPYVPPMTGDQETKELKAQSKYLKDTLKEIEKRLEDLKKPEKNE